jgi:DNA-binding response OmpR family regulator
MIDITPTYVKAAENNPRVFFVEDDMLLHNLLETKFEQSGFNCSFSIDGKDVVSHVQSFQPDVIVLDIMLPGVSGLDILAELKQSADTKHTPVIMFSNRDEQSDRILAESLGAEGFYVKALTDLSDLVAEVERLAS